MKRSEMLKIMQDAFHEGMSYKEKMLSGMEIDQAERVLNAMEKAGMLPPGQEKDLVIVKTMSGELIGTSYETHEWEKE